MKKSNQNSEAAMKKLQLVTLLAVCTLSASSIFAFKGKGFNSNALRYQWDSGFIHSVTTPASVTVNATTFQPIPTLGTDQNPTSWPPGPRVSGNNAASEVLGFDTNHRGKKSDTISAVQFAMTDIEFYIAGLTSVFGEGSQGIESLSNSPIGKKVTIGIWQKGVNGYDGGQFNQRRNNAAYLQDYTIKPADVGQADAQDFSIVCPPYVPQNLALSGQPLASNLVVCQDSNPVLVGNGRNTRPLKFFGDTFGGLVAEITSSNPTIASTHPDHRHLSRAGSFTTNTGKGTGIGDSDYPAPYTGSNFSQYKAHFTTVKLNTAVKVSGEFWVGVLMDITPADTALAASKGYFVPPAPDYAYYDTNGNYIQPFNPANGNGWDDTGYSSVGISLVDVTKPGPGGISYRGIMTNGCNSLPPGTCLNNTCNCSTVPLANNTLNPDVFNEAPMLGGFEAFAINIPLGSTNVGNFMDEFTAIRAIPADANMNDQGDNNNNQ